MISGVSYEIVVPPSESLGGTTHVLGKNGSESELQEDAVGNDAGRPDGEDADGDAVEVTFGYARGPCGRRDATTEHVRDAATATLMHENSQHEQQAGEHDEHQEGDLKNCHGVNPIR